MAQKTLSIQFFSKNNPKVTELRDVLIVGEPFKTIKFLSYE